MTNEEQANWVNFLSALERIQKVSDFHERKIFFEKFKNELVLLSAWLNEINVTGGEVSVEIEPALNCDFCNSDLSNAKYFVDGQIKDTRWSYMCLPCYGQHGSGISWGLGQLYKRNGISQDGSALWICIAGGNPNIEDS